MSAQEQRQMNFEISVADSLLIAAQDIDEEAAGTAEDRPNGGHQVYCNSCSSLKVSERCGVERELRY